MWGPRVWGAVPAARGDSPGMCWEGGQGELPARGTSQGTEQSLSLTCPCAPICDHVLPAGTPPATKMSSKRAKAKTTKKRPQRATSNVFAMFDQSQIQEFKEAFNMIDQNRDGFIDKEDLHDMLASMGEETLSWSPADPSAPLLVTASRDCCWGHTVPCEEPRSLPALRSHCWGGVGAQPSCFGAV